jgi:hypothetical protein
MEIEEEHQNFETGFWKFIKEVIGIKRVWPSSHTNNISSVQKKNIKKFSFDERHDKILKML